MKTALLLVAFQDIFFKNKGSHYTKDVQKSAKATEKLLEHFREHKLPVIHVKQMGKLDNLSAEKLLTYELLEPRTDDQTLITGEVNAFADQKLEELLKGVEATHLLVAGLAVEKFLVATLQAAKSLNYSCTVVQDACAVSKLKLGGEKIKSAMAHKVVMAVLNSYGVEITTAKDYIKAEEKQKKKLKKEMARQEAAFEAAKAALEAAEANLKLLESGLENKSAQVQKTPKTKKGGKKSNDIAGTKPAPGKPAKRKANTKASAPDAPSSQPNTDATLE
ncbi:isochorismatase hydrolase [Flammeovirgaceae bacterium 311]|nr:isochorismatase hydrolase [Flammeovirgaceae bacterium 311]